MALATATGNQRQQRDRLVAERQPEAAALQAMEAGGLVFVHGQRPRLYGCSALGLRLCKIFE